MKARTVADLYERSRLSVSGLEASLLDTCKRSIRWCDGAYPSVGRSELRDGIIDALPEALAVGLPELIVRRWLPAQRSGGPWPARIELQLRPQFDFLEDGRLASTLGVMVRVALQQEGASVMLAPGRRSLQLGEDRCWQSRMTLAMTEGRAASSAPFFDSARELHLDPLIPLALGAGLPMQPRRPWRR